MPSPAKTPRPKRAQNAVQAVRVPEHVEAIRFMQVMRIDPALKQAEPLLFHVPNGGHRNRVVAAKLKGEGAKPGVPDYVLAKPIGPFHGLFLELKAEDGSVSGEQRGWLERLEHEGYAVCVAYGWEGAVEAVKRYLAGEWNGDRL